jgi:hypothetical protein
MAANDEKDQRTKPQITGAVDLAHLNKNQRISLLGGKEEWLTRRNFLRDLLGTAAVVGASPLLLQSCDLFDGCSTDGTCSTNESCASHGVDTSIPVTVTSHTPDADEEIEDSDSVNISITLSKKLDEGTISILIVPTHENTTFSYLESGDTSTVSIITGSNSYATLEPGTTYTVTLFGETQDVDGNYLDGDGDGVGGDDFSFSFSTESQVDTTTPPVVVSHTPADGEAVTSASYVTITLTLSKLLDEDSISLFMDPLPEETSFTYTESGEQSTIKIVTGSNSYAVLSTNTTYTVTLGGTTEDIYGNLLDGDGDGTGGDDFSFSFSTAEPTCSCDSDSGGCTCVGFYCSCTFAACQSHI